MAPPELDSTWTARTSFEYLLLGDLRQLLDEEESVPRQRWLLAVLDTLLASRPRALPAPYLPVVNRLSDWSNPAPRDWQDRTRLYHKLQRLRDRIVHHSNYGFLADEIKIDLGELMNQRAADAARV